MTKLEQLETAVQGLTPAELQAFRQWFADYDAAQWDARLSGDVAQGRLDWLAAEAQRDRQQGRCTDR